MGQYMYMKSLTEGCYFLSKPTYLWRYGNIKEYSKENERYTERYINIHKYIKDIQMIAMFVGCTDNHANNVYCFVNMKIQRDQKRLHRKFTESYAQVVYDVKYIYIYI